jgi:hypothetical protein
MIFLTNHEFQASENSEVVLKFTQTYEPSFLFTKPFPPLWELIFSHTRNSLGFPSGAVESAPHLALNKQMR